MTGEETEVRTLQQVGLDTPNQDSIPIGLPPTHNGLPPIALKLPASQSTGGRLHRKLNQKLQILPKKKRRDSSAELLNKKGMRMNKRRERKSVQIIVVDALLK